MHLFYKIYKQQKYIIQKYQDNMKPMHLLLIIFVVLLPTQCSMNNLKTTIVNIQPTFLLEIDHCPQQSFNSRTLNTTIPTVLHLDLLRNAQIQDPFFSDNYLNLSWVSSCAVSYSKNFTLNQLLSWGNANNIKDSEVIQLIFEGIDTYSTVYFNGHQILKTNNAFVEYRVPILKDDIKQSGNNTLKVSITPTSEHDEQGQRNNRMPFAYAHTRKPCYQYSWDWAPNLNTMGIWKPIYIVGYTHLSIDFVWIRNRQIKQDKAILNFAISFKNTSSAYSNVGNYLIIITNNNTNQTVEYRPQSQKYNYIDMEIKQPKLWWPNGFGEAYLYQFIVELKYVQKSNSNLQNSDNFNNNNNNNVKQPILVDQKNFTYGVRTVQLNQDNNQFTVIINGYNVYCKGANYVPPDMFYPRLTNPHYLPGNTFEQLLDDAVQSNFNMIRIWGGGQYQSEQFLELASKKGIMIFYDFMFSDSIYPSNQQFLKNVEIEAKQQVTRARNYPCLVLWCGNNQILQGIYSWGWKRPNYQQDYKKLFEQLLPKVIQKYSPNIPYIPSSPVHGVGNMGFNRGGDIHYWGVWAGQAPFQTYKTSLGPFNSQFGTQSMPVWETVKQFTKPQQRNYESKQFQSHERHNSKFNTLRKYIQMYGDKAKDFESQVYLSGLVQAYGVEIAIKYQRMAKPRSYGTLYWQMNDAWPAISWSSIDYYGRWKPLQYMAKRSYPDISVFSDDGTIQAINDNLYAVQALVIVKLQNFNGTLLLNQVKQVKLAVNQVIEVMKINKQLYTYIKQQVVVYTEIIAGRQKQMSSTAFFLPFKQLQLKASKLYVKYIFEYNVLILKTDGFIKNLYISSTQKYIRLSDNYFDMIAKKEYKIHLEKQSLKQNKEHIIFKSYRQIHLNEPIQIIVQDEQ